MSFHSYERLKTMYPPASDYFCVVSASTSGGMAKKMGEQSFRGDCVATLIDRTADDRYGRVLVALDDIGYPLPVKAEEGCTLIEIIISKAICVAPTTLARRARAGRFNAVESDRLVALVAVFDGALSLFENDKTATTEWISSPVRGLGSKRPLDMLGTGVETKAVFDFIGQLERGILV
jgi:putative toxin-antitoxin system antitoxin component (TIGR02293 family)